MTKFFFRARDWNGSLVKGVLDLPGESEVVESIRDSGLVPLSVGVVNSNFITSFIKMISGRVGLKQVATFTRQLATMMTAGLALTDALSLLKEQAAGNQLMEEMVEHFLAMVRGGQPLAKAMEKYDKIFGRAYVASIRAGEEGGVLEEILNKLADSLEDENDFRGKVKGAMIYPIIVVIGMIIVAFIMMVVVIPKLMSLYADFGTAKMPAITLALMRISNFTAKTWFMFPLVVLGMVSLLRLSQQNKELRLKKDGLMLKLPIMGELNKKTVLANTTRTMSMLLTAGISLVEALKIVAEVAGNEVYKDAYLRIAERVQKGFSIASSFEETTIFPIIVTQMVATGEATGKLDEVLLRVSNYFSTEAEQSVKALTSAIEPLIMIVLGIGVAFLVIAVIMPIYNLTSSF